jgi:uncharacterized integral membrane protein (TIGR00698 family)
MPNLIKKAMPGLIISVTIALAVRCISEHLGGPAMLYALLFGMAFNFLADDERFATGLRVASRNILRIGVALLGIRITMADVLDLGWPVIALVAVCVALTIVFGWLIGRACGLGNNHSILSAGAVAICGASAALAIASVLPPHKNHERDTILTVASVTVLSTVAMVVYPVFVTWTGFDNTTAGVFLGATIHDVAQVVGAGYMISDKTGEVSTLVKLMRVAFLVPVVLSLSVVLARRQKSRQRTEPLLPWFLIVFIALIIVNSAGWVPIEAAQLLTPVSGWCLLTAVAALGVKTSLKALADVGPAPVGAMCLQTLVLAAMALGGIWLMN